jgi:hypothetical protein
MSHAITRRARLWTGGALAALAIVAAPSAHAGRMCDTVNAQTGMLGGMLKSTLSDVGGGALVSAASADGSTELATAFDQVTPLYAQRLIVDSPNMMAGLGLRTAEERCAAIVAWTELVSSTLKQIQAINESAQSSSSGDDEDAEEYDPEVEVAPLPPLPRNRREREAEIERRRVAAEAEAAREAAEEARRAEEAEAAARVSTQDAITTALNGIDPLRYAAATAFIMGDGVTDQNFDRVVTSYFPAGDKRIDMAKTMFQALRRANDADLNRRIDRAMGEALNIPAANRTRTISNQALFALGVAQSLNLEDANAEKMALLQEAFGSNAFMRSYVGLLDIMVDKADRQVFIRAISAHFADSWVSTVNEWAQTADGRRAVAGLRSKYCGNPAYQVYCTDAGALTRGTGRTVGLAVGGVLTPIFAFFLS